MAEKQKTKSTRGIPRSAGHKGKKRGGFYYKLIMEQAKERRKRRHASRMLRFALRRDYQRKREQSFRNARRKARGVTGIR
jgi:hypothetical protein